MTDGSLVRVTTGPYTDMTATIDAVYENGWYDVTMTSTGLPTRFMRHELRPESRVPVTAAEQRRRLALSPNELAVAVVRERRAA